MTDDYEYWSGKLESSQADFAESIEAKKAKERIYNMVMKSTAQPNQTVPSFSQAQTMVDNITNSGKTKQRPKKAEKSSTKAQVNNTPRNRKKPQKKSNTLRFASAIAVVAAFAFVIVNLNPATKPAIMTQNYYNPPLVKEDLPIALTNSGKDLRTLAADNNFYLAYEENQELKEQTSLLLHSRNSKINWKQLFITDDNNNLITPLFVDEKSNYITLPASETDLRLEVADEDGNVFECTIPKYI